MLFFEGENMPDEIKKVDSILFEEVELHTDCTVQVLKNLMTGEISIGWWDNNNPPTTFGC